MDQIHNVVTLAVPHHVHVILITLELLQIVDLNALLIQNVQVIKHASEKNVEIHVQEHVEFLPNVML